MNEQQRKDLRTIAQELLQLPPDIALTFDMGSSCGCAWGMTKAGRFIDLEPRSEFVDSETLICERLGVEAEDSGYLFYYGPASADFDYRTDEGRAAIEEFAERVENVIGYYDALGA